VIIKFTRGYIKDFFRKNLILLLVIYFSILVLVVRYFPSGTLGILLVPFIIICAIRWRLKGGLISAIIASSLVTISYFFIRREGDFRALIGGPSVYFLTGSILGLAFEYIWRTITKLEESEQSYHNLYEKFKSYFDLVQVIIVTLDIEGRVTSINSKGCDLLGFREEEIIGKDWFDSFIPEEKKEEIKAVFSKIISGDMRLVEYYENPVITKDGRRLIAWHNSAILDDTGSIIEVISAGEDITELKRLEAENEEKLRNLNILYNSLKELVTEEMNVYKRAHIIARICVETLGVDFAWVGCAEPYGRVRIISKYPPEHPYTEDFIVRWDETPLGQGPAGRVIRTGTPQIIEDTTKDKSFIPWRDRALRYGFYTVGAFPLISHRRTFGVLNLYSGKPGFFTPERKDFIQTFAYSVCSTLENARLFEDLQKRLRRIQSLRKIDVAIAGSTDMKLVLNIALNEVIHQLNIDAVDVFLYNPYTQMLEYTISLGFRSDIDKKAKIKLRESLIGRVALARHSIEISDLKNTWRGYVVDISDRDAENFEQFIIDEDFNYYYGIPLISKGKLLGVLEVFCRSSIEFNGEEKDFLEVLAGQIAVAIDNVRLLQSLEDANMELTRAYEETIEGWAYVLDLRDRETEGHSQRVADLTIKIAERMGIGSKELVHIRRGALLHDIGKMAIPDSILLKPDRLTEKEWDIMKKHPIYAYQILSRIEYLSPALDIPYCHHERWDGSGYPRGLKGEEIPLSARIFAVVDVFDALTSNRPYRKAWTRDSAIEYIRSESGRLFDPDVVKIFLEIIEEDG
jgi:PAS domain S-box-containing protein/putative nucleotidyltransferase with HDIG domain